MTSNPVIFLHGAGRSGVAAWPLQAREARPEWEFLERPGANDDPEMDCRRIIGRFCSLGSGHVVAHSFGAVAALLVAQREPGLVRTMTLLEPACFDLARGRDAVERHIAAMTPVYAVKSDPSVSAREFSRLFAAAMESDPPDVPDDVLAANVARLRSMSPPWGYALSARAGLPAATLVLTGGTNPLYEQTARALADLGAVHEQLTGFGHRVQDHPDALNRMARHWATG